MKTLVIFLLLISTVLSVSNDFDKYSETSTPTQDPTPTQTPTPNQNPRKNSYYNKKNESHGTTKPYDSLVRLTETNFVTLKGPIDEKSSSDFIRDAFRIKNNTVYVFISSPGGSITSGNKIIETLNTLQKINKTVVCIADFAASMAFVILQSCPTRLIMDHSIIMQHQASLGVEGPIEQARNMFGLVEKLVTKSNTMQSERLGLDPHDFHDKSRHDWWIYSDEILKENAADDIVNVVCDFDIDKTYIIQRTVLLFTINIEFSLCPLIRAPKNYTIAIDHAKMLNTMNEIVESDYSSDPNLFDKNYRNKNKWFN